MRRPGKERARRAAPADLFVRLGAQVTLAARPNGRIAACFEGHSIDLGQFGAGAAGRARTLTAGLPLRSFMSAARGIEDEVAVLVRRLAGHGLLEYHLEHAPTGAAEVVIEPQMPDYWPRMSPLGDDDVVVLSRFAYLRRRGNAMVLESPRAGALFRICNPELAAVLATLATPQPVKRLRRRDGLPGVELLALLLDCQILLKVDAARGSGLRADEGDDALVLWDFHDLLFHARSTQGRHANPTGGVYPYAGVTPAPPAVRPRWPGRKIDLRKLAGASSQPTSPVAKLLRQRHSTRLFDQQRPITLAELARLLDATARVQSKRTSKAGEGGPPVSYAMRPYPSGGASYELELYLAVDRCEGLPGGFYHYDAGGHALVPIAVRPRDLEVLLRGAEFAMDTPGPPQILITIAARFARVSWKYSSIAYGLILKDVGVLMQTLYLMATDLGLGVCAIGTADIDLFAKMTGIEFHVEGPVGQLAIGRGAKGEASG